MRFVRNASLTSVSIAALLMAGICLPSAGFALQSQNPIQAMKDAWKQAKQQTQQQQNGQQPQQQPKPGQNPGANLPAAGPGGKKLQQSSAKVEPTLMAASESGLQFYLSYPGGHIAAIAHRGSRMVVLFDGTEGPKFDTIVPMQNGGTSIIQFSPDGNRYAYIGRSGNEDVIMVDGKEITRFDEANTVLKAGSFYADSVDFSPNSKHFFFMLHPNSTNGHESQRANFYWDGVPGPQWADQAVISPDGDHYTYYLRVPNPNGETDTLIVDGKPAGYLASNPQFTFDGKHLITQNSFSRPTSYQEVLLDGKPIMKTNGVQIYMPPAGYNFLAVLGTGIGDNYRFLVSGGKKIEGSECRGSSGYEGITFSPDGKHWAARCQSRPGFHFVVADGKKGLEYGDISSLAFTTDGTLVYFATQGQQHYVVLGGEESQPYDNLIPAEQSLIGGVSGPTVSGNHIAYVDYTPGVGTFEMVVDGKGYKGKGVGNVGFSPDGKHFAFVMTRPDGATKLVVDGVEQPGTFHVMGTETTDGGHSHQVNFVFSPDSNHIAWWGIGPDQQTWGIFVDGKMMPASEPNITPLHLSFSADSKHIMYQAIVRTNPPSYPVFVDGRVTNTGVVSNSMVLQSASTWVLSGDGSLMMFGQDQDGIKRFHITPADDTSIATITGGASMLAKGN
jgi:hypothetical protein